MLHYIETNLIHAGDPHPRIEGAVVTPIFQSATYEYGGEPDGPPVRYIRYNNSPNHNVLHAKLAAIEHAEAALVTSSGMAAISTALLSVLSHGDHLLAQSSLYGGTHVLVTQLLPSLGISYDFIDANDASSWEAKLRPNTKAIYVESLTNPLLEIADLEGVVQFAQAHGLVSLIDNTFPSPMNFCPIDWGFDVSLHSATKYLNGHSDIVAGAIIGRAAFIAEAQKKLKLFGGSLDPHACFLLERGMKTLALRMNKHNESAFELAQFLAGHFAVSKVYYPGLPSHPQNKRAEHLFQGFGGMLSFELKGGLAAAEVFFSLITIPIIAPSLGGVETLITRPAMTSHAGLSRAERQQLGIEDGLIRLSVGIETTVDLMTDFEQALEGVLELLKR